MPAAATTRVSDTALQQHSTEQLSNSAALFMPIDKQYLKITRTH
jgi:hypothetical protein